MYAPYGMLVGHAKMITHAFMPFKAASDPKLGSALKFSIMDR